MPGDDGETIDLDGDHFAFDDLTDEVVVDQSGQKEEF